MHQPVDPIDVRVIQGAFGEGVLGQASLHQLPVELAWVGVGAGLGVCGFGHDVMGQELTTVQNQPIDTARKGRVGFASLKSGGEFLNDLGHRFDGMDAGDAFAGLPVLVGAG